MTKFLLLVLFFHLASCGYVPTQWCPLSTYVFPRDHNTADYVRYQRYFPHLYEATTCAWIETNDYYQNESDGAVLWNYGLTNSNVPVLSVALYGKTHLKIWLDGRQRDVILPVLLPTYKPFHLCHLFSAFEDTTYVTVNGFPYRPGDSSSSVLPGGGFLILGNQQITPGQISFNQNSAFKGRISNFMVWPRLLNQKEIYHLAHGCKCPVDYAAILYLNRVQLGGEAFYDYTYHCPILTASDRLCNYFDFPDDIFDFPI